MRIEQTEGEGALKWSDELPTERGEYSFIRDGYTSEKQVKVFERGDEGSFTSDSDRAGLYGLMDPDPLVHLSEWNSIVGSGLWKKREVWIVLVHEIIKLEKDGEYEILFKTSDGKHGMRMGLSDIRNESELHQAWAQAFPIILQDFRNLGAFKK